jgi:hypothetical protein
VFVELSEKLKSCLLDLGPIRVNQQHNQKSEIRLSKSEDWNWSNGMMEWWGGTASIGLHNYDSIIPVFNFLAPLAICPG